jgi:hypothetical protein
MQSEEMQVNTHEVITTCLRADNVFQAPEISYRLWMRTYIHATD